MNHVYRAEMKDVRIGDIVSFMDVDFGIDIEPPVGFLEPLSGYTSLQNAWIRASTKEKQITPDKNEVGLVVERGDNLSGTSWFKVLIRGGYYWFDGRHLIDISLQNKI